MHPRLLFDLKRATEVAAESEADAKRATEVDAMDVDNK
jgi:hypothetical protein